MEYVIAPKTVAVKESYDVCVIGGGPAGTAAAIAAARNGASTVLIEKRAFMGGNVTASYVETCNWYINPNDFKISGIYAELENGYRAQFGSSDDIRPNAPHRFSSEYLKIFLDETMRKEGVKVKFHSFVNDVIQENGEIRCVIIQTKKGPEAIEAKRFIDCTGDGDVAFSAGVPFDQGRAADGKCQPGTVNFRIAGVDSKKLTEDYDHLRDIMRQFHEEYRAGKTGLRCYRQDLPMGRMTAGGQISYINYACAYGIDPTDVDDLSRGEAECRSYILEMFRYMKEHYEGMENIEISSIAPEIGFRDGRRIKGVYELTEEDIETDRKFDDVIAVYPRFYDMLTPDETKLTVGDGGIEGKGYEGHILVSAEKGRTFGIPYRCLLPIGMKNLLVAGRCISSTHVAESSVRGIYACSLTGQAAGTAAALSIQKNTEPARLDVKLLQKTLRESGMDLLHYA
ncbi:MAG: FAD-dependent oxidoreductase [Clostridia bacterium]|nr:FAD-dependent oxidoreductase [Clostridia bacterium]